MKGDFTRFTFDPKKRYTNVLKQQGRVDLDADWNAQSVIDTYLDRISRMDLSGVESGAPSLNPGFLVTVPAGGGDFNISAGRFYAEGNICELFQATTYLTQPFPPSIPPPFTAVPAGGRTDFVYLDVWQRHITAIEDPSIKEIALSGPDTTTRLQTIFQIRIDEDVGAIDCQGATLPAPSDAVMTSSLVPVPPEDDLCLIGATGGYRGLENRLYRVEIDAPGPVGTATFKWSRDNGSVVFPILEFVSGQPTKVRVTRLGRDQVLNLHEGDWVEVLDDRNELAGTPGTVTQIQHIDSANRELTFSVAVSGLMTAHPKVRRWDLKSVPIATSTTAIPLEDGIQVSFGGANLKTGDYWMFAARATDGTIEALSVEPANGIKHIYARLAVVTWTSSTTATVQDCRSFFPKDGETKLAENCCCCTVTAGEGGEFASIQEAISKTPLNTLLIVCLRPGIFKLTEPVHIERSNVVIRGCNERTQIFAPDGKPCFIAGPFTRIAIESISLVGDGKWAIWSQASRFRVSDCDIDMGGIWIAEGSAQVEIINNRMTNGRGPGVALRLLPPGFKTQDLRDINGAIVSGNSFSNFGDGAIVCGYNEKEDNPGKVFDIEISNNLVDKCAEDGAREPYIHPAARAAAGIALIFASRLSITKNTIAGCGASKNPVCGVSLVACSTAEVSCNTIVDNGVRANAEAIDLVQAGIFGFDISNPGEGLAAYRIEGNSVVTPAGQSLLIISGGDMIVANNRLHSSDLFKQPESLIEGPLLGISLLLTNLFTNQRESADGRLLCHGNQVFSNISGGLPESPPVGDNFPIERLSAFSTRCLFFSNDDISVSDNQFLSRDGNHPTVHILVGVSLVDKTVTTRTARVTGNRVRDGKERFAILSFSPSSVLTSNQTSGNIRAIPPPGPQIVVANNVTGV